MTSLHHQTPSHSQHKPTLVTHPEESVPRGDDDDEWEEVEANPQSSLYALNNEGINPPPVPLYPIEMFPVAEQSVGTDTDTEVSIREASHSTVTFAISRSSDALPTAPRQAAAPLQGDPRCRRLPLPSRPQPVPAIHSVIQTRTKQHRRGISTSLPNSPFALPTSNSDSTLPQHTSRIIFPEDMAATPPPLWIPSYFRHPSA
ncbi:hypothetical protein BD779DRAFT_1804783 [Infundibulicybe gibba]|nr:hypothetical protein BD779DRAFT_1804783 [Infundibulicybe gibba]